MPTYVYACKACGHEFEKFQSFNDKALRTCPQCAEKTLAKVIFPAGVVFKGSGFYVNDSKSSTSSTTSTDTSSDNGSKDAKKDAKQDTSTGSKKETSSPAKTGKDAKS